MFRRHLQRGHLPFYRQAERFARDGLALPRSTLADWMARAARLGLTVTSTKEAGGERTYHLPA